MLVNRVKRIIDRETMRERKMPSTGKKEPIEDLKDKLRSFFGPRDPQKKKNALPPKTHFNLWYLLIAFFLFTYLQQYFLSRKVETIPYGQFKALAGANVSKLTIGPENITGTLTGRETKPGQQFTTILPFVLAAIGEAAGSVGDPCPAHLFIIERSKNANIVVYDANRGPAGDFAASEPVVAYWLLNGERGQREELNAVERKRAYGFDVTPGDTPGTYAMAFKASRKRSLTIRMLNGCPVATALIGGHNGILRRIFVQAKDDSFRPKVEYIDLFGDDVATGGLLYEKFVPEK
jgi:hypothetical protein